MKDLRYDLNRGYLTFVKVPTNYADPLDGPDDESNNDESVLLSDDDDEGVLSLVDEDSDKLVIAFDQANAEVLEAKRISADPGEEGAEETAERGND
jgi:hypothetical protein